MEVTIQYYEDKEAGGIRGWHWINTDSGAWDGPKDDWETSHKANIIQTLQQAGKQFNTVIQAGGNQGMYPKLLSKMFRTVYTFEPDHLNFYSLSKNCVEENIIKLQTAVGDVMGSFISMNRHTMHNTGMHTVSAGGTIPLIALDALNIPDVDLIMLDLEGYEINAIRGAYLTIAKYRPIIFAERPSEEVISLLYSHGYSYTGMSKMDGVFIPN